HFRHHGRVLVAEAFYDPPTAMLDKDFQGNISAAYTCAVQASLLDVDPETGTVEVRRVASAHDVGRALNPGAAEGQVHGGIHMGLGYALSEKLVVEEGQILTQSFMDYAVLKAADMPEIVVRRIETVDAEGPFGAKGLGASGRRRARWCARSRAASAATCSVSGAMRMPRSVTNRLTTAIASGPRRHGSTRTSAYALEGRTNSSRRACPTASTAAAWCGSPASRSAMTTLASRTTIATLGVVSAGIPSHRLPSGGRRSQPASPR